jgi:aminoglycoside phosphotransferase (APT) family kinase protein
MTSAARAILPESICSAIASTLPKADFSDVVVLGKGIATTAYRFKDPSGTWVARVSNNYPEPWTWRGGRRYEVPLLRHLTQLGLPAPREAFELPAADGRPAVIIEREVAGSPLTALPVDHQDHLARQLAHFLSELHSISLETAHALGMHESRGTEDLRAAFQRASSFLDKSSRRWIDDELTKLEQADLPKAPVHADFRPDHWYCDADFNLLGVIDFGDTTIDDPAVDFARIPDDLGDRFLDLLLDYYTGPKTEEIRARALLYKRLRPLSEVADADGVQWWDRDEAVRQLTAAARTDPSLC